jgi:23S rRNA pseudouridine955/2504/2580 synthase
MSTATTSVQTTTVGEDDADIRLDRFLRRLHPGLTQGAIQKFCRTGQVRVDGKRVEANARLAPGQSVRIPPVPPPAPAAKPERHIVALDAHERRDLERLVLYRDDQVLVLNKPSGLATQGGQGIARHLDGMLDALQFDAAERPRLVHRLDRDTSGVLVLARTTASAAKLAAAFRGRDVKKTYWAIVVGLPTPMDGKIDLALTRTNIPGQRRTEPADRGDEDAVRAITDYVVKDHAGKKFSWLELEPLTGRTHQLRVHCAALGTPILGDAPYGGETSEPEGFSHTLHLHARALSLPHPKGGRLTVTAELPPHMQESFAALGFSAPPPGKPIRR